VLPGVSHACTNRRVAAHGVRAARRAARAGADAVTAPAHHAPSSRRGVQAALARIEQALDSDAQTALAESRQCLSASMRLAFTSGVARSSYLEGHALATLGQMPDAIAAVSRALVAAQRAADTTLEKRCLRLLAAAKFEIGDFEAAADLCLSLLRAAEKDDDVTSRIRVLQLLANTFGRAGQYERSLRLFEAALALSAASKWLGHGKLLLGAAICHQHFGDVQRAQRCLTQGLAWARDEHDRFSETICLARLGLNQARQGNRRGALALLRQAAQLARRFGGVYLRAECHVISGIAYLDMHMFEPAQDGLHQALALSPGVLNDRYLAMTHDALATLAAQREDWRRACLHLLRAKELQSRLSEAASSAALDAVHASVSGVLDSSRIIATVARTPRHANGSARQNSSRDAAPLTQRQEQILMQVAAGRSNAEIADSLGISANTVRFHLSIVFSRLGARRRGEAALIATRMGLLPFATRQ
jgi:DNA-binding CsgD family transcriptional regulator/tetratricopeptide (TPR) repeat protein